MSFLAPLMAAAGPAVSGAAKALPAVGAGGATGLANAAGKLFGTSGSRISEIAGRIGSGANQIAAAGGAQPGYQAAPEAPQAAPVNYLQMLDPAALQSIIQQFGPKQPQGGRMPANRGEWY